MLAVPSPFIAGERAGCHTDTNLSWEARRVRVVVDVIAMGFRRGSVARISPLRRNVRSVRHGIQSVGGLRQVEPGRFLCFTGMAWAQPISPWTSPHVHFAGDSLRIVWGVCRLRRSFARTSSRSWVLWGRIDDLLGH